MPTIGYHHLTYEQRCHIFALLKRGCSQTEIAKDLNVSQSTICRESKRNGYRRKYSEKVAQKRANQRKKKAVSKARKMTPEILQFIDQKLKEMQWSPEQISGHLKQNMHISISHESIYRYIWKDKYQGGKLYKNLRRVGKKYNHRGNKIAGRGLIPNRIGIEERPAIVDEKRRVGDVEIDTVVGVGHQGRILTMVDRKTKLARLVLMSGGTADETRDALIKSLTPIKKYLFTLTADNGKEFAKHLDVASTLGVKVYFARPYHSWERGLNENTNGLLRQYFPKGTDFTKITHEQVQHVEYLLNTRPRKSLNFQTPLQVFILLTGARINYALLS